MIKADSVLMVGTSFKRGIIPKENQAPFIVNFFIVFNKFIQNLFSSTVATTAKTAQKNDRQIANLVTIVLEKCIQVLM